jgi:hypothetical protein
VSWAEIVQAPMNMKPTHRLVYAAVLLSLTLSAVAKASPAAAAVAFVGEFSNMHHTSEHAYGYSVQLWRNGYKLFGFLSDADGFAGDTPTGLLEDVHFDAATGALSFTAKLSVGSVYLGKGQQEATHDFFTFKGTFQNEKILSGTLTHADKLQPGQVPISERLRLVKTGRHSAIEATSYDGWKQSADRILEFRGPKW